MLLTTSLFLALLATPAQEAEKPTSPRPPSPPRGDGLATVDSGQAARRLIDRARQQLYDIQAAGLESLSFTVPIRMGSPSGETIHLGDVTVNWIVSSDPKIAVTVSDILPRELAPQTEAISFQLEAQGRQILRFVNNDIFSELLGGYEPTLVGLDGDLVQVHFEPNALQEGAPALDWFFDAEAVPVKVHMTVVQGDMSMSISYEHTWQPASTTDSSLVLQQLTIIQEMGSMRHVITTTLDHDTISGLVMLVGYTENGLLPRGEAISNNVQLQGLSLTSKGDN